MRFVLFYHSLVSDWNHGNAHFLRGVATELLARGHEVDVYEPRDGWSLSHLTRDHGAEPLKWFAEVYPQLRSMFYDRNTLDLDSALADADVVLVHEWNESELINAIGRHRAESEHYRLLFHDTHHRLVTAPDEMAGIDLELYDGVLAFGRLLRDMYRQERRVPHAWTWHEAADTRVFRPHRELPPEGDLVWIGNWGDGERTEELEEFLLEPVRKLKLKARVYGVRYPEHGVRALRNAGIEYGGWLPNFRVPDVFGRFRVTLHIPRRPYRESIPGIPTIRVFEALACGIPLVSVAWEDLEELFRPERDYLVVQTGEEMTDAIQRILDRPHLADKLTEHGLHRIRERHTCAHRVDELEAILAELGRTGSAQADQSHSTDRHAKPSAAPTSQHRPVVAARAGRADAQRLVSGHRVQAQQQE